MAWSRCEGALERAQGVLGQHVYELPDGLVEVRGALERTQGILSQYV